MTSGGHGSTRDSFNALKPTTRSKTVRTLFRKKKKKSYLTAKALCLQLPLLSPLLSLQYRFISMFDNCILCCSSRVPFQLRCPFKPTFRRDRKEVLFPSRDSSPRDIYTFSPLLLLFSFFLFYIEKRLHFVTNLSTNREISRIFSFLFFCSFEKEKERRKAFS